MKPFGSLVCTKPFRLSRRSLLRGAAGVGIALPALEAMEARAQVVAPRRLVIIYSPNGTNGQGLGDAFWPAQTGAMYPLSAELAPLAALRSKMLLVSGVNGVSCRADVPEFNPGATDLGDLHSIGMSQMLTGRRYHYQAGTATGDSLPGGYASGISVDQYLAQKLPQATRFRSLEFGVMTATTSGVLPFSRMISLGDNQPVPPVEDPVRMFERLFTTEPNAMSTVAAQRKSVLDFVRQDVDRLQRKVSAQDRAKLDSHLTAIRDLEQRLSITPTTSCGMPTRPPALDPTAAANFPTIAQLQLDLLALAITCDLTRIASFQFSWARSQLVHTWTGTQRGHHDMSHQDGFGSTELSNVNAWYATQVAALATKLDAARDVDGNTVLDNALVYWCSEVGWAPIHDFDNLRTVFLGSGGGAIKTGLHVSAGGVPHQRTLVTLLNAMGVAENQFGDIDYGTGPLPGVLV